MLGVICFRRRGHDDAQTDELGRRAVADGYTAPSTTILDGRTVARLCTINPRTSERDIEGTIERLAQPPPGGPGGAGRDTRPVRPGGAGAPPAPPCSRCRSNSRGWSGQDRAGGRQGSLFGGSV